MGEFEEPVDSLQREMIERRRGMLTESDRKFLWGYDRPDEDYAINQKRFRIRRRIRHSLLDFAFLSSLREEDVRLIFEDYHSDDPPLDLEWGVWGAIQWLYIALGEEEFLHLLETAIEMDIIERRGGEVTVDVDLTIKDDRTGDELDWPVESKEADCEGYEIPDLENLELMDAALEVMEELDNGYGADQEKVISVVADRQGVAEDDVKQAIQDALLTGRCYEPDESTLKAI
ncbi:hypothetical protein ACYJ1Y_16080 [Natrialbaceae archaeon A-gly3]